MSILTLEIEGKAVACISAGDRPAAEGIVRRSWFQRDLLSHRSGGAPLWNGSAELSLRRSTPEEVQTVEKRFEAHRIADDPHRAESGAVVFLVTIEHEHDDAVADVTGDGDDFPI